MPVATFSLIVQILSYELLDLTFCSNAPNEALLVRDSGERSEQFEGRKEMMPSSTREFVETREESRFYQMVEESTVFVDKSLFIAKILQIKEKIVVINAPRKSGKTINLNMLKDFFALRVHQPATIQPITNMSNYRFFTEGKLDTTWDRPQEPLHYFPICPRFIGSGEDGMKRLMEGDVVRATYNDPPLISHHQDIIDKHLAQYSVIQLDFMNEPFSSNDQRLTDALYHRICYFFKKFVVLHQFASKRESDNKTWSEDNRNVTQQSRHYQQRCFLRQSLTEEEIENSMVLASRLLHAYFGKPVMILVDNYDALFSQVLFKIDGFQHYQNDAERSDMRNGVNLLKRFLKNTLAENPYLAKAVIMGTLSVSKKKLFQGIPDLIYYNAIDNDLQEFFGFTDEEMKLLFLHFEIPADMAREVRRHYKGYTMKPGSDLTLYSMESAVKFFNTKVIEDYWIREMQGMEFNEEEEWVQETRGVNYWFNFGRLGDLLRSLIDGKDKSISFVEVDHDMGEVLLLIQPEEGAAFNMTKKVVDIGFSMLLEMGFFILSERGNDNGTDIRIRIPNREIRRGLEEIVHNSTALFRVE